MKNPYEVLGIGRDATQEQIGKAYRDLARKHHPDLNPENQEDAKQKFKEATEAFEILGDEQRRAEFDNFGGNRGPFSSVMDDFFSSIFSSRPKRTVSGDHILVVHEVDLHDVANGIDQDFTYKQKVLCEACRGVGGEEVACVSCNGTGRRIIRGQPFSVQISCETCGGTGKIISKTCDKCEDGYSGEVDKTIRLIIPKGIEDGMQFSYRELGNPSHERSGNLYVTIKVKKHPVFDRLPNGNLLYTVPVTYTQLVLGDEIEVPTLFEKVALKIPPGTEADTKFKMKGKGLPRFNNGNGIYHVGDQIVQVRLEIPTGLDDEYRRVLMELKKLEKGRQDGRPQE